MIDTQATVDATSIKIRNLIIDAPYPTISYNDSHVFGTAIFSALYDGDSRVIERGYVPVAVSKEITVSHQVGLGVWRWRAKNRDLLILGFDIGS